MRVLIACEYSGIVKEAFRRKGHDAWSCDILSSEYPKNHIQDDVLNHLSNDWDLMIAHPPCTFLASTGARWLNDPRYPNRKEDQAKAVEFVIKLWDAPIDKIALENPVGMLSSLWKKPSQYIQPFWFGDRVSKKTGLWLKNLPLLQPTKIVDVEYVFTSTGKKFSKWYWETSKFKGSERQLARSKTFLGIANAFAEQWG